MAGGGAEGDAPDAQASALGLPNGQPQPPKRLSSSWDTTNHGGVQREVSSLRQHLEDKHLAPSWPPSERTPDLTLSLFPRYDDYGMDKGKTVSCRLCSFFQ